MLTRISRKHYTFQRRDCSSTGDLAWPAAPRPPGYVMRSFSVWRSQERTVAYRRHPPQRSANPGIASPHSGAYMGTSLLGRALQVFSAALALTGSLAAQAMAPPPYLQIFQ